MKRKQKQTARPRRGNLHGMYRYGFPFVGALINVLTKPRWDGVENLPPRGAFIAAPNHMSSFDPLSLGFFMADNGYEIRFMAKHNLFEVPLVGPFFRWWGMIPVERGSDASTDALRYAREALEEGSVVGIYLEGTLTRDPAFWPMKGKTGLARLALDTRVPVVPIVQWGAQDVMDRYVGVRLHLRRPGFYVRVLPPVDYSDIEGDSSNREGVRELTRRIERALTEASADLRGEEPPETPWDMKEHDGPSHQVLKQFSKWRVALAKTVNRQDILAAKPRFRR